MYHMVAYAVQAVTVTTLQDVPAVTDNVISIRNSHIVPPVDMPVLGAYALGAQLTNCYLLTPKINATTPNYVVPFDKGNIPTEFKRGVDFRRNPFTLKASEELQFKATNGATTSSTQAALVFLQTGPVQPARGEIYKFRWTSTTAAVAITWTTLTVTFNNTLPAGQYAVVGGSYYAANAIACRVIFPGQVWRGGMMGMATEGQCTWQPIQDDAFDTMGVFSTVALPIIEVLNAGTDATHTGYLDLIKIA